MTGRWVVLCFRKQSIILEVSKEKPIVLRNQKVLLDCDVAELYGVKTKEVNQAVKNNPEKFPYGYIFVLDKYEKSEVVKNFDHLNKLKFSTVEPTAFTQRGLYMLATIIKSPRATNTTLAIVDTFVTVRELANTMEQPIGYIISYTLDCKQSPPQESFLFSCLLYL